MSHNHRTAVFPRHTLRGTDSNYEGGRKKMLVLSSIATIAGDKDLTTRVSFSISKVGRVKSVVEPLDETVRSLPSWHRCTCAFRISD